MFVFVFPQDTFTLVFFIVSPQLALSRSCIFAMALCMLSIHSYSKSKYTLLMSAPCGSGRLRPKHTPAAWRSVFLQGWLFPPVGWELWHTPACSLCSAANTSGSCEMQLVLLSSSSLQRVLGVLDSPAESLLDYTSL